MSQSALISWKEECDAIHREMDSLLTAGWLGTAEERQVRKIQFMALIERRNVAAQNFLKFEGDTARFSVSQQKPSKTPEALPAVDSAEPPHAKDRDPQAPRVDPMLEGVKIFQEPPAAALAADRSPHAPLPNPVFDVRNFLKSLRL